MDLQQFLQNHGCPYQAGSTCNTEGIRVDSDMIQARLASLANIFNEQQSPETKKNSSVRSGNQEFKIVLDLGDFNAEEIKVKQIENWLIKVEAKHEDREEKDEIISRHIVRKFKVPEVYDMSKIASKLTKDSKLEVVIPVIGGASSRSEDIEIPIQRDY